jgi:hypothetical protein
VAAVGPPAGVSSKEWSSIQAQLEAERHKVVDSDHPGKLYRADNPTQRFTAHFGAEDVVIEPIGRGEPEWHLGLRLTAWGAVHDLKQVEFAHTTAEENRVEVRRGPLTEWYVNTTMGLEQGFTIDSPPTDDIHELVLEMTIDGDLTPELTASGQSVTFRREGSNTTLTYSGLAAWDAVKAPREARMELADGGTRLRLVIGVAEAVWPVTVDPIIAPVAKLLPTPDLNNEDAGFGTNVKIDGDLMVAWVNNRMLADYSGALDVFERIEGAPTRWNHVARIATSDHAAVGSFGISIGISNDTIVVGAPYDDAIGENSGSVFVFQQEQRGSGGWHEVLKLTAFDGGPYDNFGYSVAIDGDTVVVGTQVNAGGSVYIYDRNQGGADAWGLVTTFSKPNGSFGNAVSVCCDTLIVGSFRDDDLGNESGSAYVYDRNQGGGNAWGQVAKVVASDGSANEWFGYSVSFDGDTLIVSAPFDEDSPPNSGSAFVFQRDHGGPGSWGQVTKITPSDGEAGDYFGYEVSISGDNAIVGAWGDDDIGDTSGAAYLYHRNEGGPNAWGQMAKFKGTSGAAWDNFGASVAISANIVAVGVPGDDGDFFNSGSVELFEGNAGVWGPMALIPCPPVLVAEGESFANSVSMDGNTAIVGAYHDDDHGENSGSAYVFRRDEGGTESWGLVAKIIPEAGSYEDHFGNSVSIDGDTVVVGSDFDDVFLYSSGSAYVFQRDQGGPGSWGQVAKITPTDGAGGDRFGFSVSVSGNAAVIGTPQDDDGGDNSGSSYVFVRDHGGTDAWGQVAKITLGESASGDRFGSAVSISGSYVIAGSPDSTVLGLDSGSAYVFVIGDRLFVNGFETGDTSGWSATVP